MRNFFALSSLCITTAFFCTSCSTAQHFSSRPANQGARVDHEFIEGITLDNGTSNVEISNARQTYRTLGSENVASNQRLDVTSQKGGNDISKSLSEFIQQWYGVPYRLGGTTKLGIDCSAFVQQLYGKVYDLELLRTASQQFSTCKHVSDWRGLKEGDLVFFKIRTRRISHVGVYLGDGKFVHASLSQGVMISDLTDTYWTRYFAGGGKVSGLDERES